jgi:hypothetical protein
MYPTTTKKIVMDIAIPARSDIVFISLPIYYNVSLVYI